MQVRRFVCASAIGLSCCAIAAVATSVTSSASAAGSFGVGLRLGKVLHSIPVGSSIGPWLVWNPSKCSFQQAATHPRVYKAAVRRRIGGPTRIGFLNYGDTDPFGVANTKSIRKWLAAAGIAMDYYNIKYPSTTEPLVQARNAITKKEPAVLESQQISSLDPAFYKILQKDGCIPSVALYLKKTQAPSMGALWEDVGTAQGVWLAQQAKRRGWKPSDTALVSCTDPSVGASVNIMFDTAKKALLSSGYKLPSANMFRLVCTYSSTSSAQIRLRDWLTAHPNYKHLLINTIDDERTQGEIQALKASGRFGDALTIAGGADELGQKQIKSGQESASVAFFPERYGEWLIPLLEDVMAGNPVPSFTATPTIVLTKANIRKYYP
jgi:ribose transport system substrate-binding protein